MGGSRGRRCANRLTYAVLRRLYLSSKRRLALQGRGPVRGSAQVSFEGGRLFLPCSSSGSGRGRLDELRCLSTSLPSSTSASIFRMLYLLPYRPAIKVQETWPGPLSEDVAIRKGEDVHRRSLFLLRKDNCLYRHDLDNGRLLEKVLEKSISLH